MLAVITRLLLWDCKDYIISGWRSWDSDPVPIACLPTPAGCHPERLGLLSQATHEPSAGPSHPGPERGGLREAPLVHHVRFLADTMR